MNVLSLFDGISCGQIALEKANIPIDKYFSSEINKHAIKVTQDNYPNTIQLGDIRNIKGSNLPKIDLIIGGSPCQGFSFAGKRANFEDPRSALFFEYVRLLNEIKPKYFLLENVKMSYECKDFISSQLNVKPILIDSSLVSAQHRERLYWTNIPIYNFPEDKNTTIKDILEDNNNYIDIEKYTIIRANPEFITRFKGILWGGAFKTHVTFRSNKYGVSPSSISDAYKVYSILGKYPTLTLKERDYIIVSEGKIRRPTIIERCRMQNIPDNYIKGVNKTHSLALIGNSWTVDIITHILKGIHNNNFTLSPY